MRVPAFAALLAVACFSGPARGQEDRVTGGIKGGVNASRWIGVGGARVHLGLGLGGFVTAPLAGALSLQTELLVHEKGADFDGFMGQDADEGVLYLELPVLVRYDLALAPCVRGYGAAGPGFAYVIDSKRIPKEELNRFDVTLGAALGARFTPPGRHAIDVELRFSYGLLNLLDRATSDDRARNLVLGLFAGVTL